MTDKGYDPFSYGQVPIPKTPGRSSDSPEDILFDSPTPQSAATAADTSWDPPAGFASVGNGIDFGAEILGERARPQSAPVPARQQPEPAPRGGAAARTATARPAANATMPVRDRAAAAPAAGKVAARPAPARPRQPAPLPLQTPQPRGAFGLLTPLLVVAAGEGAAMWLHFVHQNTVMAGIAAAIGLALGGVTWFAWRR